MSPAEQQSTRQRILDAALERMALRGYAGTSMSEIGRLAGLSKPGLYNHFSSKEELLMELLEYCIQAWTEASLPALTEPGLFETRLREHLEAAIAFARNSPHEVALVRLASTQLGGDLGRRVQERMHEHKEEHSQRLTRLMQEAIESGEIAPGPPEEYVLLWRVIVDGLLLAVIFQTTDSYLVEERLHGLWKTLWRAFAPARIEPTKPIAENPISADLQREDGGADATGDSAIPGDRA
ncbi:MAG: TetR/AcrR family transcriptional regulator [Acidobacteriota bacterium]